MTIRIRGDQGQWERKGDQPRKNRMITVTDQAWSDLQSKASERGVSRSDLIELAASDPAWPQETETKLNLSDTDLETVLETILQDPTIVRSKDRAAVRRGCLALIASITGN